MFGSLSPVLNTTSFTPRLTRKLQSFSSPFLKNLGQLGNDIRQLFPFLKLFLFTKCQITTSCYEDYEIYSKIIERHHFTEYAFGRILWENCNRRISVSSGEIVLCVPAFWWWSLSSRYILRCWKKGICSLLAEVKKLPYKVKCLLAFSVILLQLDSSKISSF